MEILKHNFSNFSKNKAIGDLFNENIYQFFYFKSTFESEMIGFDIFSILI